MPSARASDWQYEADEAEPNEAGDEAVDEGLDEAADSFEAADEADEAEYAPGYAYGPYGRQPQRRRPYAAAVKGVQTAVVTTPSGNANIQLPSKVPTLAEFRRTVNGVQQDVAATNRRIGAARRLSSSRATRAEVRGAHAAILLVVLDQLRDFLKDVGIRQLIQTQPAVQNAQAAADAQAPQPQAKQDQQKRQ